MAQPPKEPSGFFSKVVRFVASPTADWAEQGQDQDPDKESEFAKSELRAMVERKRRNDFVRKREFDMLRRVRREGLNPDQLAALGTSSRLDESEVRSGDNRSNAESSVKAKIDEIEKQMVAESYAEARRDSEFSTLPPIMDVRPAGKNFAATRPEGSATLPLAPVVHLPPALPTDKDKALEFTLDDLPPPSPAAGKGKGANVGKPSATLPSAPASPTTQAISSRASSAPPESPAPAVIAAPTAAEEAVAHTFKPLNFDGNTNFSNPLALEVSEVMHDPELDEAVIAFANADFELCEHSLLRVTSPQGPRFDHAETWLALFDLYRAIGQHSKFEALALEYAQQFGWSAPQWFSMPQMVAERRSDERPRTSSADMAVGWSAPAHMDIDSVARLRSQSLQLPIPWVFDWSNLITLDTQACLELTELFKHWAEQDVRMRWLEGGRLFSVLADLAPPGVRDADPAYWKLRMEALRMTNRPDQYDEVAIDYCVTYEVSPPAWEPAVCVVRLGESSRQGDSMQGSMVTEMTTGFAESRMMEDPQLAAMATVELSGQLVGDASAMLDKLSADLGASVMVKVSCERLIRVDFVAAGDIFNWVVARRAENRSLIFTDVHRLLALFFGAMGINEQAQIKVRSH